MAVALCHSFAYDWNDDDDDVVEADNDEDDDDEDDNHPPVFSCHTWLVGRGSVPPRKQCSPSQNVPHLHTNSSTELSLAHILPPAQPLAHKLLQQLYSLHWHKSTIMQIA